MTMQDTIKKVDKQQVEKSVRDWKKRVSDLYSTIKLWLKDSEYSLKPGRQLPMYEELMYQFNVPSTEVDTAVVYKGKTFVLTIKPTGLWVIGANGIIDILSLKNNSMLIDIAEEFETPQWKLFNGDKKNAIEFNKQTFFQLLKVSPI